MGPRSALAIAVGLLAAGVAAAPAAGADGDQWALNGVYLATSNGEWAQTNDVYHDEASLRSTWTISTVCSDAVTCSGQVHSDAGWDADIQSGTGEYVVKRNLPDWERCEDGSVAPGLQIYRFYPVNGEGYVSPGSPTLAGVNKTYGVSGACRLNLPLIIEMPFRLQKIG
ncbi:hypothetical protein ACAG26_03265 [Mycobacterium sp. pUA109]|uniref:hypothetical protein n=1 Tax=Mycobacterium sp. pUA109 TaxID=3238982 RepID=UPI00351AE0ED